MSELIPGNRNNVTQIYIFLKTDSVLSEITKHLTTTDNIKIAFYIESIKRGIDLKSVQWSIENNLMAVDIICFTEYEGEKECNECEGKGYFNCRRCTYGYKLCQDCDGTGEMLVDDDGDENYETCDYCNGDGEVICEYCDGTGKIDCEYCDGTGEVDDTGFPTITVSSYIFYDLNMEEEMMSGIAESLPLKNHEDSLSKYPVLFASETFYNSDDLEPNIRIPEENYGECFINRVYQFDDKLFIAYGNKYQNVRRLHQGILKINGKLTSKT